MRTTASLIGLLGAAGCGVFIDPAPTDKQLSIIESGMPQQFVETADTVPAGPLQVKYDSYGSSTCNIPAGEQVSPSEGLVRITAYDRYVPPQTACTEDFGIYHRSVTITLTPGTVVLALRGIRTAMNYQVGELRKTVVVK